MGIDFSPDSVPPPESDILKPARITVTSIVQSFLERLAAVEKEGREAVARVLAETTDKYRTRIILGYVLAFSGCVVAAASGYRIVKDGSTIQSLQQAVLQRDLQNIRLSIQGHSTSINGIRTHTYVSPDVLTTTRRHLLSINSDLAIQRHRLQQLGHQTRRSRERHQDVLQLNGLVNQLESDIVTLLESMSLVESDLRTAQSVRSERLRSNPLALAAAEIQARRVPCDNDALQASCNGPLNGIACYALTRTDPRRAPCEIVRPLCRECNLPPRDR